MYFLNALPGAVAEGLIWGIMAIGVYLSFKILDIADLTVDGSICTGGCVCVLLMEKGVDPWLCVLFAFIAGALAGAVTGLLNTALGIPSILAGILTQLMLYSVNLTILGGRSLLAINTFLNKPILSQKDNESAIIVSVLVIAGMIIVLWRFFYTEIGLTLKSTGDNPDMSRAQGVNVNLNKVIGLALSNGIVAISGALYSQYKGSVSINDGRGAIVIGLAAIFIGLSVSLKIKPNFVVSLIGVTFGSVVYYTVYNLVMLLGLNTNYLKMFSALIVAVFLAVPYLKTRYFTKRKPLPIVRGGDSNA